MKKAKRNFKNNLKISQMTRLDNEEDMIKVNFEPVFGIEEEFLVWFEQSIGERRFAGISDFQKIKEKLLTFQQIEKFEKESTNSFYINKERLLNSFEDVFL